MTSLQEKARLVIATITTLTTLGTTTCVFDGGLKKDTTSSGLQQPGTPAAFHGIDANGVPDSSVKEIKTDWITIDTSGTQGISNTIPLFNRNGSTNNQ